jgi:hypothetical protein
MPEIGTFQAQMERLELTEDRLCFKMTGYDDPGRGIFSVDGEARYVPDRDAYTVADRPLTYSGAQSDVLRTRFEIEARVVERDSKGFCYVSIEWEDPSGTWIAHALLPEVSGAGNQFLAGEGAPH